MAAREGSTYRSARRNDWRKANRRREGAPNIKWSESEWANPSLQVIERPVINQSKTYRA